MWKIIVGLMAVMLANIFLGMTLAELKKEFNKDNLYNGIFKAGCILVSCFFMYSCALLNPEIMVANINGIEVNLIEGMKLLFTAGIILYGGKDLMKLRDLLKISTKVEDKNDEEK